MTAFNIDGNLPWHFVDKLGSQDKCERMKEILRVGLEAFIEQEDQHEHHHHHHHQQHQQQQQQAAAAAAVVKPLNEPFSGGWGGFKQEPSPSGDAIRLVFYLIN